MIRLLIAFLTVFGIIESVTASPLGYHRRELSGWTLLAISVPLGDYTALVMDRPPGMQTDADSTVRASLIAGRRVERVDGADPERLVRLLMTRRAAAEESDLLPAIARHALALAGEPRSAPRAPRGDRSENRARPVLLLAGGEDPDAMMEHLLRSFGGTAGATAHPRAAGAPGAERNSKARLGWWRHVEREGEGRVVIGVPVTISSAELAVGAHIAVRALAADVTLDGRLPRSWRIETRQGSLQLLEWSAPADSTPVAIERVTGALKRMRGTSLPLERFDRLHAEVVEAERRALRRPPSRWFPAILADEVAGRLPRPAHEAWRVWKSVSSETVREAVRGSIPHRVTAVSTGALVAGESSQASGPTERWRRADVVRDEELEEDERAQLARDAIARAARALWPAGAPEALTAESDWSLARSGGPFSGRLIEIVRFPDAIRRDYYPAGPDLVFSSWLVADSMRTTIQGAPRDTFDGERARLLERRGADVWNVVRIALERIDRVEYAGAALVDGEVFQSIRVIGPDHVLEVDLAPETGLPARVFLDVGESGVSVHYRFASYILENGYRYPGRIERHVGARREAVFTVRAFAPATRLAASRHLQ